MVRLAVSWTGAAAGDGAGAGERVAAGVSPRWFGWEVGGELSGGADTERRGMLRRCGSGAAHLRSVWEAGSSSTLHGSATPRTIAPVVFALISQ